MTPEQPLLGLLQQWRTLTEAEGRAIDLGDWRVVEQCQSRKEGLQTEIDKLAQCRTAHPTVARVVSELISLEHRNAVALRSKRAFAEQERDQLEKSDQNLRQLHRAYAPGQALSAPIWNSYS